jgi:hypothetical protein
MRSGFLVCRFVRQLFSHPEERETGNVLGIELYQHVEVAVRTRIAAQGRAKEGKVGTFYETSLLSAQPLENASPLLMRTSVVCYAAAL